MSESSTGSADGVDRTAASESMTVAELLALCGSANHDAGDKSLADLKNALGEAHPAVAGSLVEHLARSLDESTGKSRGTASATEHPDWHESLDRVKERSQTEGYDVE